MQGNKHLMLLSSSVFTVVSISILFCSFTLWLIDSQIKYTLFVFEIFTVLTIYLILVKNEDRDGIDTKHNRATKTTRAILQRFGGLSLDLVLLLFSLILILFSVFHISSGVIQLALALSTASLLSGYAILNSFNLTRYFSKLEVLVLSFLLSFIFSGFSSLAVLSIDQNSRVIAICIFFIIAGVTSAFRHFKNRNYSAQTLCSFSKNVDILAIALCIIFYAIFFYYVYPNFTYLPGSDISVNDRYSILLSRSPDLYTGFSYLLFHSFEATLHSLSGIQPVSSFLSIQVILNIFLPLAIYIFSKRYFGKIDKRIPALAAIFYTLLSNFSFIYFAQLKILPSSSPGEVQILGQDVAEKAYNATINFLQPFSWFVPLSVSFMMFIIAFMLLKVEGISRIRLVLLYSVLILSMYLTHVTEAVIFAIFISIYSFFYKNKDKEDSLRLDDSLLSCLIGLVIASTFAIYTSFEWHSNIFPKGMSTEIAAPLIVSILSLIVCIIWRSKVLPRIHFEFGRHISHNARFYSLLSTSLVIIYLFGFLTWIFIENFRTSSVYSIGVAPWFIYPLMLGIVGLLALLGIRYVTSLSSTRSVAIILVSILFMFLMGRAVSYLNLNLVETGYWEKRFLFFIYAFMSVFAPIALLRFKDNIDEMIRRTIVFKIFLISITAVIVISGFSSTVLQSLYWFGTVNNVSDRITPLEFNAINYLKKILQHDSHAFVITPSLASGNALEFAAPGYQFPLRQIPITSKYPAESLLTLASHNLSHAYIYLHSRDLGILSKNHNSWLVRHLLPMLPVVFSNKNVTIFNASHVSYPLSRSDTNVLVPGDIGDDSWLFGIDAISQSGKNYTMMNDKDPDALKAKNVVLTFDPVLHNSFYDNFSSNRGAENYSNYYSQWVRISGNWVYSNDGLHAGDKSGRLDNTILSPISSNNFTATTSFRIKDANQTTFSYLSIIYSWQNPKNFSYAGITTHGRDVYVSFTSVTNGKRSFDPVWPGLKTDLKWKNGNSLNITLSVSHYKPTNEEHDQLIINGSKYLERNYNASKPGYVGLSYGRIQEAVFKYYGVKDENKPNLRTALDYMAYAKSGGNLVIINTNKNGFLAKSISHDAARSSIEFSKVTPVYYTHNARTNTGYSLWLNSLFHKLAQYHSVSITEDHVGLGRIAYIDIQPLVQNGTPPKVLYNVLGRISQILPLSSVQPNPVNFNEIQGIFREVKGTATSKVTTASLIFPSPTAYKTVKLSTPTNKSFSFTNVTVLDLTGYQHAVLSASNNLALTNGIGLYSNLTMSRNDSDSSVSISFDGGAQAALTLANGKTFNLKVSNLNIKSQYPISLFARQPQLELKHANITITELYSSPFRTKNIPVAGQNLVVHGNLYMSIFMSDTYTLAKDLSIDATISRIPPLSQYNEVASFLPPFSISKLYSLPQVVRVLILLPFLIAFIFIFYSRPSEKSQISGSKPK